MTYSKMHPALAQEFEASLSLRRAAIPISAGGPEAWSSETHTVPCQYGKRDGGGEAVFFPATNRALVMDGLDAVWVDAASLMEALDKADPFSSGS